MSNLFVEELELQNFAGFRQGTWTFGPGPIGLVGANGSGKSTILNAIYYLLTGDGARFPTDKRGLVHDAADTDEYAFARGTFRFGGIRATILRSIRPDKTEMHVAGEPDVISGHKGVKAQVEELIGVPSGVLGDFAFIEQRRLLEMLRAGGQARLEAIAHSCGIDRLRLIHEVSGKWLERKRGEAVVSEESVLSIERSIGDLLGRRTETAEQQKRLAAEIAALDAQALSEQLLAWRTACRLRKERDELEQEIEDGRDSFKKKSKRLSSLARKIAELQDQGCDSAEVNRYRRSLVEAQELYDQFGTAQSNLNLYQATAVRTRKAFLEAGAAAATQATARKAEKQLRRVRAELDPIVAVLDLMGEDDTSCVCPSCKREVDAETVAEYRERRTTLQAKERTLAKQVKAHQEEQIELSRLRVLADGAMGALDSAKIVFDRANSRLRRMQLENETWTEEKIQAEIAACDAQLDEREAIANELGDVKSEYARVKAERDALLRDRRKRIDPRLAELRAELEALDAPNLTAATAARWQAEVDRLEHLCREGDQLAGRLQELDRQIESQRLAGEKAKRSAEVSRALADQIPHLEAGIEEFHWKALPRELAARQLGRLAARAAEDLDIFGSPFRVRVLEDMRIEAAFPGYDWKPAERLSVGQQSVLCLPLAVAAAELYEDRIGVLALDEPSESLDETNLGYLRDYLLELPQRRRNLQVFAVTHSAVLAPAFAQLIEVEAQR